MSYITNIETVFKSIYPDGTFMFKSEVDSDSSIQSITQANYPLFIIDDEITSEMQINSDANGQASPALTIYCLTKFDTSGDQVNEHNSTRVYQFDECVKPMEDLAFRVMAKYMREYPEEVLRDQDTRQRFRSRVRFNLWTSLLYGVEVRVLNLFLRENINYCNT